MISKILDCKYIAFFLPQKIITGKFSVFLLFSSKILFLISFVSRKKWNKQEIK